MLMRALLFLCLALFFSSTLFAQYYNNGDKFIVGLSAGLVKPMGDFAKETSLGVDLSLNGKLLLNPKVAVGLSVGYIDFAQDDEFWNGSKFGKYSNNYQVIPVIFTATYFIQAYDLDFRPYTSLGFGYTLYRNHTNFVSNDPSNYSNPSLEYTVLTNKVGLMPNVGFMYNLSRNLAVDVNLKFTYIPNFKDKLEKKNLKSSVAIDTELSDVYKYRYLGFDKLTFTSLTIGLYYRFSN